MKTRKNNFSIVLFALATAFSLSVRAEQKDAGPTTKPSAYVHPNTIDVSKRSDDAKNTGDSKARNVVPPNGPTPKPVEVVPAPLDPNKPLPQTNAPHPPSGFPQ